MTRIDKQQQTGRPSPSSSSSPPSNRDICLTILGDAVDRARQKIWDQVAAGEIDKKRGENLLINMDKALAFSKTYLHDHISGKDAKFITQIRKDRTVLMGHQAQRVYFSIGWDTIRTLAKNIDEFENYQKDNPAAANSPKAVVDIDVRKIQLEALREKGLITENEYKRYRSVMGGLTNE